MNAIEICLLYTRQWRVAGRGMTPTFGTKERFQGLEDRMWALLCHPGALLHPGKRNSGPKTGKYLCY